MIFGKKSGLSERLPFGDKALIKEFEAWGSDHLEKLPTGAVLQRIPQWHLMARDEFLEKLEHAKRESILASLPQ